MLPVSGALQLKTSLDQAITIYPRFEELLQQNLSQRSDFTTSVARLRALFEPTA